MRAASAGVLGLALAAALAGGCGDGAGRVAIGGAAAWPAPVEDRGEICADVAGVRACWGGVAGSPPTHVAAATFPDRPAASAMGWRCAGGGARRACADRLRLAPAFVCANDECVQSFPRVPDDGDWSCVDSAGVVVCVGGHAAAGVAPAPAQAGWRCGERGGAASDPENGPRICVDLSPDVPDGRAAGWRCRFDPGPPSRRRCARAPAAAVVGAACDPRRPCVDGAFCVGGACVPGRPAPACFRDTDCGAGRDCRFGSCRRPGS